MYTISISPPFILQYYGSIWLPFAANFTTKSPFFFVSFNKNTFLLVHAPEKALLYRITVFTIKTSRCRIFISRNPVFSQAFLQLRITLMQQLLKRRHLTPCLAIVTIQLTKSKMMRQTKMHKAKVLRLEQLLASLYQLMVMRL